MPDLVEIAADIGNGAEIACLAAGEEEQLVEKLEGCCRGLVDTGNDEDLAWTLLEDILGCVSRIRLTLFDLASSFAYDMTS